MLVVVVVLVVIATAVDVGLRLAAAVHELGAIARVGTSGTSRATRLDAAVSVPSAEVLVEGNPETPGLPTPDAEPYLRFDTEAAVREAGERDPNVAELLNDSDPEVGGALRDFMRTLDRPGDN